MELMNIYSHVQLVNITAAICLNLFLIFLVIRHSHSKMGRYKYLIVAFACFEISYASVVCIGMPINFVGDESWIVFTHTGPLSGTPLAILGAGLYCTFYETWVGFIVTHFVYRYIVVCRPNLSLFITNSRNPKIFIAFLWILFLFYTTSCSFFFCTRLHISDKLANIVRETFEVEDPYNMGYILLRKRNSEDNSISFAGTTTVINHFLLAVVSSTIVFFCGISIWRKIRDMKKEAYFLQDVRVQRQMFFTLVVQTLTPMVFCHIPTLVYLSFPFWETDVSFGSWSLMYSILSSMSKWVDPIIVIVCMKQYRTTVIRMIKGKSALVNPSSSYEQRPTTINRSSTNEH